MFSMFESKLTLKYDNKDLEKEYTESRLRPLRLFNIIYSSVSLAFSIVNTILYALSNFKEMPLLHAKYITYITTAYFLVIFLLALFTSNKKIQLYTSYFNFLFYVIPYFCLRLYIDEINDIDFAYHVLIYTVQVLYGLVWFFTGTVDFKEGSLITALVLLVDYISFGPITPLNMHYRFVINAIVVLFQISITYLYVYEKKKAYYFNKKLKSQNVWYDSIIQHMDSGFIKIKSDRIIFINKTLYSLIEEYYGTDTIYNMKRFSDIEGFSFVFPRVRSLLILKLLLKNFEINDSEFRNEDNWLSCKAITKGLGSRYCFKVVGTVKMCTNTGNLFYEVSSRFKYSRNNEEVYEFMFKNISISKINAELKYKTLFLSKIAHEFKNPLLSIHEFINQIRDILLVNSNDGNKINEILQNIESMSDYLVILIKDMDFFSLKTSEKPPELNIDDVRINDIISFCKNITQALIKRSRKEITFKVEVEDCPVTLYTDEIKLKEILINLLSNAVKFTNNGYILLKICKSIDDSNSIDSCFEFQVQDTGKGINTEQKTKLFKTYFDDVVTSKNPTGIGLGLGLYIVKELLSVFGSEIIFESEEGKGTTFKFKLPIKPSDQSFSKPQLRKQSTGHTIKSDDGLCNLSNYSHVTRQVDYNPMLLHDPEHQCVRSSMPVEINDLSLNNSIQLDKQYKYILLVDDETVTRKSTKRVLDNYFSKIAKLKILEASDGFECLYLYYITMKKGVKLNCIISDETMDYLNGTECARILQNIWNLKNMPKVPFYLLTAYECLDIKDCGIDDMFTKPLSKRHLNIIKSYIY
jgi:signal transduction histidine kinase/CheY-like chemotaxis protein